MEKVKDSMPYGCDDYTGGCCKRKISVQPKESRKDLSFVAVNMSRAMATQHCGDVQKRVLRSKALKAHETCHPNR